MRRFLAIALLVVLGAMTAACKNNCGSCCPTPCAKPCPAPCARPCQPPCARPCQPPPCARPCQPPCGPAYPAPAPYAAPPVPPKPQAAGAIPVEGCEATSSPCTCWPDYGSARTKLEAIIAAAQEWQMKPACMQTSGCVDGWALVESRARACKDGKHTHSLWTCADLMESVTKAYNKIGNMNAYAACANELNHMDGGPNAAK